MILPILLMARNMGGNLGPAVSGVTVATGTAGACHGVGNGVLTNAATVVISWSMARQDAATYTTRLFENGVALADLPNTTLTYTKTIAGNVENGVANAWTANYTYRVDVVRTVGPVVVSTASAAPWVKNYGTCS